MQMMVRQSSLNLRHATDRHHGEPDEAACGGLLNTHPPILQVCPPQPLRATGIKLRVHLTLWPLLPLLLGLSRPTLAQAALPTFWMHPPHP
jgi:hypothetical protein